MITDLHALKAAPVVEPFTGPAILSGRASAVFFHEVFGHRVEGHRQKSDFDAQTFKKQIGQQVLPEDFSVTFDPTLKRLGETELAGYYPVDNEGVKARRVVTVDKGILKTFLMSRTPLEGIAASNGHGRGQPGMAPVARQSNLIVQTARPRSHAELKAMLLEAIKQQHKPFGLYFKDIQGGFTITGRVIPNAFNVLPVMVYRVLPDGREELVRGVDLIGTPLTAFSKIVAGDNQTEVFNGMCGAESGFIPVSAASPAVFVSQIEVQKKEKGAERPPLLPPPFDSGGTHTSLRP
jgi:predicted Zn-dependent protease